MHLFEHLKTTIGKSWQVDCSTFSSASASCIASDGAPQIYSCDKNYFPRGTIMYLSASSPFTFSHAVKVQRRCCTRPTICSMWAGREGRQSREKSVRRTIYASFFNEAKRVQAGLGERSWGLPVSPRETNLSMLRPEVLTSDWRGTCPKFQELVGCISTKIKI